MNEDVQRLSSALLGDDHRKAAQPAREVERTGNFYGADTQNEPSPGQDDEAAER